MLSLCLKIIYRWLYSWSQELLHQSVLSRYTYLRHISCYWGKKTPPIETKSKCIILPYCGISHLSASVVRVVRAGENPDLFLVRWNLICLYHFHEVLVIPTATLSNGYVSASSSQKCSYSIDDFAF